MVGERCGCTLLGSVLILCQSAVRQKYHNINIFQRENQSEKNIKHETSHMDTHRLLGYKSMTITAYRHLVFTESESKHPQALRDAHKLFVGLLALSARLVFVKRAGGFPNQADSAIDFTHICTHTHTHKHTKAKLEWLPSPRPRLPPLTTDSDGLPSHARRQVAHASNRRAHGTR